MATDYTTKLKHKRNIFFCLDTLVWLLTPIIMFILAISHLRGGTNILSLFSDHVRETITGFGITALIAVIGAIIVKDRIKPFLGAVSVILAAALYGTTGMFIVFGIELFEEYVLNSLYKHFANKYTINKEIDNRSEM